MAGSLEEANRTLRNSTFRCTSPQMAQSAGPGMSAVAPLLGVSRRKLEGSRCFYESSSRHPAATKGIETPRRHGEWTPTYWTTAAANIDILVCSYLGDRPCCGGTPQ